MFPIIPAILIAQARTSTLTGTVKEVPKFESKLLGTSRRVLVWLPPGYEKSNASYPALILLDGQNVFDGARSYIPGEEWRCDETAAGLINAKLIAPLIMIAVDNTGAGRMDEYTTVKTAQGAGKGDVFGRFLIEELMPVMRKQFRLKTGASNLGIAGASLGGLISIHFGLTKPTIFGKIGGMSPSVWWGDRHLLTTAKAFSGSRPRIWLDIGSSESKSAMPDAQALRDTLVGKGWVLGKDLAYVEDLGGEHNERAWARRFGEMLMFLYR